jgi:hypothetical protein
MKKVNEKVLFSAVFSDILECIVLIEDSSLRPLVLLIIVVLRSWVWSTGE